MDAPQFDMLMPDMPSRCMDANLLLPICVADRPPAMVKEQAESTLPGIYESIKRRELAQR
jgi:hypothetical protein